MTTSIQKLRYGENPYQAAEIEWELSSDPFALQNFTVLAGEMSMINYTDLDRGLTTMTQICAALVGKMGEIDVALGIKHGNCCGASYAVFSDHAALMGMIEGDPQAIFGGCVLVNFVIDEPEAQILLSHKAEGSRRPIDIIVAPYISAAAMNILARRNDRCKMLVNPALRSLSATSVDLAKRRRIIRGGEIIQDPIRVLVFGEHMSITGPRRNVHTETGLAFAAAICGTANSNTITLVKNGMLIGQGVGQTSRVRAAQLAVSIAREDKNGHDTTGAVAVSDSFFPFRDAVDVLIEAGIKAIFATSGSVRDEEVRAACREAGVTLYQLPETEARMFFGH